MENKNNEAYTCLLIPHEQLLWNKNNYEPFLKFPSHEHQIIIHQTPRVWLAKRKEEVLVTLEEESHNSKLSTKLLMDDYGEGMQNFTSWEGGKRSSRPSRKREGSLMTLCT
ncbi:hypothetical protein QL285_075328 [Trifolium repens]|nr:hypothetical protein QL285_075328 [Trifolium repens]